MVGWVVVVSVGATGRGALSPPPRASCPSATGQDRVGRAPAYVLPRDRHRVGAHRESFRVPWTERTPLARPARRHFVVDHTVGSTARGSEHVAVQPRECALLTRRSGTQRVRGAVADRGRASPEPQHLLPVVSSLELRRAC